MKAVIGFPNLGIEFRLNPIAIPLPIGSGGIYWYGIVIAAGIALALWYIVHQEKKLGYSTDYIFDLLLIALPVSIVGARAYYVIWAWDEFKDNWVDIFKIWEGGIAIYGGIIAAIIVILLYCRKKKLPTLHVFDVFSMGLFIGQAIGRWGNFFNQEVFGRACSLPWAMQVEARSYPVHPLFLYESLWNALGFFIMHFANKKRPFDGFTFCFYLIWYGIGRFIIEGLRDTAYILYIIPNVLAASQLVSILAILAGVVLWVYLHKKTKKCT